MNGVHLNGSALIIIALIVGAAVFLRPRRRKAPAPVVAAAKSRSAAPVMVLLLAGAGVLAWAASKYHAVPASTAAPKAAPAPTPSPSTRTQVITHTILKDIPVHNWPVSGGDIVVIVAVFAVAAIVIVQAVGRYFRS